MKFIKSSPFYTIPTTSERGYVNFFTEIPKGSRHKYEYNEVWGVFEAKRLLPFKWGFPITYGCVPRTLAADGDCLDALLFLQDGDVIERGTVIDGRIIGALKVVDKGDLDYKLLMVPSIYPEAEGLNVLSDMKNQELADISDFFKKYKSNIPEFPEVGPWISQPEALRILDQSIENFVEVDRRKSFSAY